MSVFQYDESVSVLKHFRFPMTFSTKLEKNAKISSRKFSKKTMKNEVCPTSNWNEWADLAYFLLISQFFFCPTRKTFVGSKSTLAWQEIGLDLYRKVSEDWRDLVKVLIECRLTSSENVPSLEQGFLFICREWEVFRRGNEQESVASKCFIEFTEWDFHPSNRHFTSAKHWSSRRVGEMCLPANWLCQHLTDDLPME